MNGGMRMQDQRNRLYRSMQDTGSMSSRQVLEESRKLDAMVLRYYRAASYRASAESDEPAEPCGAACAEDDSATGPDLSASDVWPEQTSFFPMDTEPDA